MQRFDKKLKPSLLALEEFLQAKVFTAKVENKNGHVFDNKDFDCFFDGSRIRFKSIIPVGFGLQTHKEIKVRAETQVKLSNSECELYAKGKNLLVDSISYIDDPDDFRKVLKGSFTSLSTKPYNYYRTKRRYRLVMPLEERLRTQGNFIGWGYRVDGMAKMETLLKLNINGTEFHLYPFTDKETNYLVIDVVGKMPKVSFLRHSNAILLTYALIKGKYYGNKAYLFSYKEKDFMLPQSIEYLLLGDGFLNGFPIHTTNPYSILAQNRDTRYKKDGSGKIVGIDDSGYTKYMVEFPSEPFEKLAEMICNKGGIQRAVILMVSNLSAPLEIKVPTLFVALENVTRVLVGDDRSIPKLVEDDALVKALKAIIKKAAKEITAIEKCHKPIGISPEEFKLYSSNFERIRSKLYSFNNGTNNKKLAGPFADFGYTLSAEEEDLIYVQRNKFLHGEDFVSLEVNYEDEFKNLFHICLRLQKLISVLLLKKSGFSGYIINNPKLYDYITGKSLKEKYFQHI